LAAIKKGDRGYEVDGDMEMEMKREMEIGGDGESRGS